MQQFLFKEKYGGYQLMHYIFWVFPLLLFSQSSSAKIDEMLKNQLTKMAEQSQETHNQLKVTKWNETPEALRKIVTALDDLHSQTLSEIISLHGWPNKQLVGTDGVRSAFVLVKNSRDLTFQQSMLPFIIQSFIDQDGISGQEVAELTDKVSIAQGKKQVFGTQVELKDSGIIFKPIANPETVDQLRQQMGLIPLAAYKKQIEKTYASGNIPRL